MKIAIVDPGSYSLQYLSYYINSLDKSIEIDLFLSSSGSNIDFLKRKCSNLNIYEYNILKEKNKVLKLFNYIKMLIFINKNKHKYKCIHFQWSIFFPIESFFFFRFKNKLFFTFHNDVPHNLKSKTYLPFKIIHLLSKKSIFLSKTTYDRFKSNYKYLDIKKLYLNKHGIIPISSKVFSHENLDLESSIVFWGSVKKYKGVDVFLQFKKKDINFKKLEILGYWDKDMISLLPSFNEVDFIKIKNKFLDEDELLELMNREVIFILPYLDATQSGIMYNLVAHEKIFISSNVGDIGYILEKYQLSDLLFDNNDISTIYKAIDYCYNNKKLVKEKIKEIKKDYSWSNISDDLTQLYGVENDN